MVSIRSIIICFLIVFLLSGCVKKEIEPIEEMPAQIQEEIPEAVPAVFEVKLTEDLTMVPDELNIQKGTTVKWIHNANKNMYHQLVLYSADIRDIPTPDDIIARSGNFKFGESWEYDFEEAGEYKVRDIYAGTMRGEITAEVIREITPELLEDSEVIGTIYVE